jgi:hypothetical protein
MTPEQVYAALLACYPKAFREAYGDDMMGAFRDLRRANRCPPLAFWRFVIADLARSVCQAQLDACRSGARRFALRWLTVCALAATSTGLVANLVTWSFSYLYHPYLEGLKFAPWSYGAFLGVGLGVAQSAALRNRFPVSVAWVLVSATSTAVGLHLTTQVASLIGPVACGIALGGFVGSCQWMLVRTRVRRPGWSVLASAVALPIAVLSCNAVIERTLSGMNPVANIAHIANANNVQTLHAGARYADALGALMRGLSQPKDWTEFALECAVMGTAGLVIGAITARSISEGRHAH